MRVRAKAPCTCLLLALTMQPTAKPRQPTRETEAADVYEAVIRYQIKSWKLAAKSYCVKMNGRDPKKDFLDRFHPLPVKGASGCRRQTTAKVMMQVRDKKTGNVAVIFDVEAIRWLSENEAEVEGGYLCGSRCMAGGNYHLLRDGTHWVVTGYGVHIIS